MSLRYRLYAYLVAAHLLFLGLTMLLLRTSPWLMIGLEAAVLLSFMLGVRLIRRALEPLGYTRHFHDLLQDQQYAARLQHSADRELNELVELFNTMLGRLYQERLQIGEQQGFLDRLLEATPSAVIVFDFDGRISLLNASAQALLGLDNAKGKPLRAWLANGDATAATPAPAAGHPPALLAQLDLLPLGESRLLTDGDGRRYRAQRGHFYDRGFARHFLLIEELTEELESSEKDTYDKLIRVLAHEVNNTVAATGSVLDSLLYYRGQLNARDGDDFDTAIVAVKRRNVSLGEFIERFTRVVKMPAPEPRPNAVRDLMDDILYLYREPCRARGIRLAWARCDEVPAVALDRHLMEQALLNVVKNAMEAVEEAASGEKFIEFVLAGEAGGVRLSVIDSGNLLGKVPARQLFTPFFTTKKGGQGIGLLFVREVMNRHGFAYRLAATGDGATRFDIWFTPPR
ncbi:nitrogen fixation/metabolism regulation signal transduction histidine kinase [Duganella sp. 1411]|jgi:nitrogen fixation/metabolism regulation signal transduction histidine kinase|uniref:sensor histidine kinase n=1 Tax=Duganella sp. 1411 TaxID=2806572 RepID=UPI001AE88B6E|nr:ATP-binding protein [Duganella sp. 1411]MBP1205330.1 nitrogen fixation/metabolism regulation signal transduction histidine kinase [Duganella sp. 1411]